MFHTKPFLPTSPDRLTATRRQRVTVGWLAGLGVALGTQAAVVQLPLDLLQPGAGLPPPASTALERALAVDTNIGQRNLDLLLDARRAGEAVVQAAPRTGELPDKRLSLPSVEPRGVLVPLGLQAQESAAASVGAERREWLGGSQAARSGDAGGGPTTGGRQPTRSRTAAQGADDGEPSAIGQMLGDLVGFLRENRFPLLGGAAVLALAVAVLDAYARRR